VGEGDLLFGDVPVFCILYQHEFKCNTYFLCVDVAKFGR
jgi:hypothetical protein